MTPLSSSRTSNETSRSASRRSRRPRKRWTKSPARSSPSRSCSVRGLHSHGVHQRVDRPVLQAVRDHHRHLDGHLRIQLAHTVARAGRGSASGSQSSEGRCLTDHGSNVSAGSLARSIAPSPGRATSTALPWAACCARASSRSSSTRASFISPAGVSRRFHPASCPRRTSNTSSPSLSSPDGASLDRTDAVMRQDGRDRHETSRCGKRRAIPRPQHQRIQRRAERWHRFLLLEGFRPTQNAGPERPRDRAGVERRVQRHHRSLRAYRHAAVREHRCHRRIQALRRGPRRARLRRALPEHPRARGPPPTRTPISPASSRSSR